MALFQEGEGLRDVGLAPPYPLFDFVTAGIVLTRAPPPRLDTLDDGRHTAQAVDGSTPSSAASSLVGLAEGSQASSPRRVTHVRSERPCGALALRTDCVLPQSAGACSPAAPILLGSRGRS